MTKTHDYKAALEWYEKFQSGDWDKLDMSLEVQDTIQHSLKIAQRLQDDNLMGDMASAYESNRAKYVGGTVYYKNNQEAFTEGMRLATQQLLKEVDDDV